MAWDTPSQSGSAGATRFVMERQYGYPVTPIRTAQLGGADLSKFQVLILPSGGNYAGMLGESRHRARQEIGCRRAAPSWLSAMRSSFLGNSRVDLLELVQENALREGDEKKRGRQGQSDRAACPAPRSPARPSSRRIRAQRAELPDGVPGAIARARYAPTTGSRPAWAKPFTPWWKAAPSYAPVKADKGINAALLRCRRQTGGQRPPMGGEQEAAGLQAAGGFGDIRQRHRGGLHAGSRTSARSETA